MNPKQDKSDSKTDSNPKRSEPVAKNSQQEKLKDKDTKPPAAPTSPPNTNSPSTHIQEKQNKTTDSKPNVLTKPKASIPPAQGGNKSTDNTVITPPGQGVNIQQKEGNKSSDNKTNILPKAETSVPQKEGNKPLDKKVINSPKQETIIPPKEGGNIQLKPETNIPLDQGGNKSSDNTANVPPSQEANIPAALAGNNQNITLITSKPFLPQTQDLFPNSNKETTNLSDQITAPQRTMQQATPAEKLFCPELLLTDEMEQHQFPKTTEIEGQNALIAKLKTDLNVLQLEFSSIKSENQNLMDCLSKSRESQKEIFNQRLETCNREMALLRENNLNSDAKIGENNRRIQALKGDIVQQNEKFSTRESQLLTEIDSLTKTLSFKEDNLNVAKHTISELNSELEQTQDRYSEVWTELKSLQTACDELTMDKNSLHLSVAEMREHIDSTVAEKDTLIDKHSALNKQIMSLKCENGFLINKAISLDKQLSELAEIQEHPSSVQHANYLDALVTSHSCLDEFAPRGAHLHIKALEHLLHLQTLNWSLQEKLNNLTS